MIICDKGFASIATALFLFSVTLVSTQQFQFTDATTACVGYEAGVNTITITCNASFLDVVQAINDPDILEQEEEDGQYILKANLEVRDGVTFEMNSSNGVANLQYLKVAGANAIIVYGKIVINGITITSWDISNGDVIQQNMNGTIRRGHVQFAASEGAQIINSEFGYLGDLEPGRRGVDLFGGGGPSHDIEIRGSKFHDMWMAFYSSGAYNITVDGNEYYNNIKYSLDPHTTTHDMNITNNWIHDNPIGPICSDRCSDILIEGNLIEDTDHAAIFFSRNMTDSIARDNHVINAETGIVLSESPNNQVYNNTIEGATEEGILLTNPELLDDGVTEGNLVYDNAISDSENGIRATRSHNNIVENITFSDIESSEYRILADSNLMIRGQQFDNALISGGGEDMTTTDTAADTAIENLVEIAGSGIIEVTEEANDGEDDDDEEAEENSYNTDTQPYTTTLGDDDSITVNS